MANDSDDDILDTYQFSFEGDFEMQVEDIMRRVRLTRREVENLQYLLNDVQNSLSYIMPGLQVYPFGSIVTGLGIKTSDVDCFIELPPHFYNNASQGDLVIRARNQLRRDKSIFAKTFAITTAKVPIVKVVHLPTGFNCDINFSSVSGVMNSSLLAFLLNVDKRALPLAILIKYWTKVYKLTGTNLLPNYALTMMVIFYLQGKYILPSVQELQTHRRYEIVENWNITFNKNYEFLAFNSESLYELLGGFFNYYKTFDYATYIIAPFVGYPIKKELFANLDNVSDDYSLYKHNVKDRICNVIKLDSIVCIQDPFDHSRNCTVGVYGKLFSKMKAYFEAAAKTFIENGKDDFLRELFTMDPREVWVPVKTKPSAVNRKASFVTKAKVNKSTIHQKYQKLKTKQSIQGRGNKARNKRL